MLLNLLYAGFILAPVLTVTVYAYATGHRRMRYIFKPLVVPSIAVLYVLLADVTNPWVLLAMGCGWIGDVFLLFRSDLCRVGGIVSFGLGHAAYITGMILTKPGVSALLVVPVLWEIIMLMTAYMLLVRNAPKSLRLLGTLYCALLIGTGAVTLYLLILSGFASAYWIAFLGALLFLVSDSMLARNMFQKGTRLLSTLVMVTYILAQTALGVGFALHGGI